MHLFLNGYKTVAVYGMKELGERLCDELKGSDVTVSYAIDKNADSIYADVDVVTPDEALTPVDVVVVTAITYFDEIEEALSEKMECPIKHFVISSMKENAPTLGGLGIFPSVRGIT